MVISFINNVTLLLALSICHSFVLRRWRPKTLSYQVVTGLLFSGVVIAGMLTPIRLLPGVIFDGRSLVASVAGLFGGPLCGCVVVAIGGAYRLSLGGAGAWTGVGVLATSAALGVAYRELCRRRSYSVRPVCLYVLGILVHLCMLLWMFTLPAPVAWDVLSHISFPVMVIFPLGTVLLGELLHDQIKRCDAAAALRESEEKYRELVEAANSIILRIRVSGRITYVNEFAQKFFGYSHEEIVGRSAVGTIVPEIESTGRDQTAFVADVVRSPEEYVKNENENLLRDGSRVWISWTNRVICSDDGYPLELLSIGHDITDRKRAEETLRYRLASQKLMSTVSTNFTRLSADGIDRGIEWAMQMIGGFSGVDRSYVFSLSDDGRFLSNTHEWCADGIEAHKENLQELPVGLFRWWMEKLNRFENIHISKLDDLPQEALAEKETLEAQGVQSLLVVPMVDGNTLRGFLGFDSVRREKRWAAEDIEILTTVSELVANALGRKQATDERDKLQNQLRHAQKMEAVGQLSGGIAHDFNNILQTILGYTELSLQRFSPSDRLYGDLEKIQQAAERAAELTRKLLAFSRRQMIRPVDVELSSVITDVSKMLPRVIGEHIELVTKSETDGATVHADVGSLEQVLMNLCVNARDAMPNGGRLTIETGPRVLTDAFVLEHPWAKSGNYALLSVTDTGFGMSQDVVDHIFEPFYTTKEVGKGTGLGLSMVYGTVKQHEGFIHCHSEPEQGTRFEIYLPSLSVSVEKQEEERAAPPIAEGTGTILLAEDNELVRELAVHVLEGAGYTVLSAVDGEEAVRVLEANAESIDMVLLDIVMPKMDGRDAYSQIKRIKPGVCALFCSGYDASAKYSSFFAEEELEAIQKPYAPQLLLRKVRDALDERESARRVGASLATLPE